MEANTLIWIKKQFVYLRFTIGFLFIDGSREFAGNAGKNGWIIKPYNKEKQDYTYQNA